jgi:hypothetical protein
VPLLKKSACLVLLIVATTPVTFSYSQATPEIIVEHNIIPIFAPCRAVSLETCSR